jgi:RNA polymerase sigma-70 factor (ECF subfamily)
MVALNRAIVVAELEGPAAGLAALDGIPDIAELRNYYLLPAIRAEFMAKQGQKVKAIENLEAAIALTTSSAEKELLKKKIDILK